MARLSEIAILSDTVHWFDGDGLDSPKPPADRPGDLSAFTGWQPAPPVPCPIAAAKAAGTQPALTLVAPDTSDTPDAFKTSDTSDDSDDSDDSDAPQAPAAPAGSEDLVELLIEDLLPADSPRLAGEDTQHVQILAEAYTELPPILVHRRTLRVIDGMHRLRAAMLRGEQTITARMCDVEADAAFVMAVEANVSHGLPLSLADREAAAARILLSHPQWSDRAIANVTGLSPKTVSGIRRREGDLPEAPTSRIGRDGRSRPVNGADRRRRASELFAASPDASVRDVATEAGISPGTARDVRDRMRRGEDPLPPGQRNVEVRPQSMTLERHLRRWTSSRVSQVRDRGTVLRSLRRDPSVRFTDSGREVLRWLDTRAGGAGGWESVVYLLPPHCAFMVADLACAIAMEWLEVAEQLRSDPE